MFFMIRGLRVLSETLRKPLGKCSSCVDVFCLREESSCPDSVAFFKQFIQEVGFLVGRLLGCQLSFVFLISIFYEGWEGVSPTGVYPFGVLPLCIPFRFSVGLTADTAAWDASGHFDGLGMEVDLWIVLVQPGEPKYHALLAEAGDCKQNMLGMSVVGHDHVDDFADAPGLIKCSVHVINQDWLGQLVGRKFRSGDEVLVNKISSGTGIDHGFCGCFFHSVPRL